MRTTLTTEQRREEILYILHMRGHETISNLANELEVSIRTIKYDIEALSDRCKEKQNVANMCSLPSKTQKSDTQNAKNRSDSSDLRKPERFFLCNIIF